MDDWDWRAVIEIAAAILLAEAVIVAVRWLYDRSQDTGEAPQES